jgi:hypothetical protein
VVEHLCAASGLGAGLSLLSHNVIQRDLNGRRQEAVEAEDEVVVAAEELLDAGHDAVDRHTRREIMEEEEEEGTTEIKFAKSRHGEHTPVS